MLQPQTLLKVTEQMIEAAETGAARYQEGKENNHSYDFLRR